MYRLLIYGEDELLKEINAEYETLEEAQYAKQGIWVEIVGDEDVQEED